MSLLSLAKKLKRGRRPSATRKVSSKPRGDVGPGRVGEKAGAVATLHINLQPLVTEKSVHLQEENVVSFRVAQGATKEQIAEAVRIKYKVEPRVIRTMRVMPKRRRRGYTSGKTVAWKKALVKVDDVQALKLGP